MKTVIVSLAAATLAACAPQIEGSYVDQNGAPAFRLMNGKYYGTSVAAHEARAARRAGGQAMPIAMPYKVDGKRLLVLNPQGMRVLYVMPDQTLRPAAGTLRYVRRERATSPAGG